MPARRVAVASAANHAFAPVEFEENGFTLGFIKMPVQRFAQRNAFEASPC
jgi:hypothetical protein